MTIQPEKGFYYHYKHDPNGEVNNAAYELIGTAFNTESAEFHTENIDHFLKDEVAVYRPLFKDSFAYKAEQRFWIRPLSMFTEMVTQDSKTFPRFQKITDLLAIEKLTEIRDFMYK